MSRSILEGKMGRTYDSRRAISARVDREVIGKCRTGADRPDLQVELSRWRLIDLGEAPAGAWGLTREMDLRMRGSVVNDVADELLIRPDSTSRLFVRRAWALRANEERSCRRYDDKPLRGSDLSDAQVEWIWQRATIAADCIRRWSAGDMRRVKIQEGIWLPASIAPDCKGGREDYRVRSYRTGHEMLVDVKCMKDAPVPGRWWKDQLYASCYLIAAIAAGRPADGVMILDVNSASSLVLSVEDLFAAEKGDVVRRLCAEVFGMSEATIEHLLDMMKR